MRKPLFLAQGLGIPSWKPGIFWHEEIQENPMMTLESILKTKTTLLNGKR